MTMSPILPPKKDVALALLERASVFVHLDPRHEGVVVPPWLKRQPQLVLQIGLNMAVKIPDLDIGAEAVSCTLSFSRRPHYCYVPWAAVYALVGEDGRGMVWPEDIPPEVAAQAQVQSRRAGLRAVGPEDEQSEPPLAGSASVTSRHSSAPHAKAQGRSVEPRGRSVEPHGRSVEPHGRSAAEPQGSERPSLVALEGTRSGTAGTAERRSNSERPYLRLVK